MLLVIMILLSPRFSWKKSIDPCSTINLFYTGSHMNSALLTMVQVGRFRKKE